MLRRFHSQEDPESGQALVEFALLAPILVLLLVGIVDLARAYERWNEQTSIANTAARYVAVGKSATTGGSPPTGTTLAVCYPAGSTTYAVGSPITVVVKSTYSFLPFIPVNPYGNNGVTSTTIRAAATTRVEVVDPTLTPQATSAPDCS